MHVTEVAIVIQKNDISQLESVYSVGFVVTF